MSSARKRAAIHKANAEADHLRKRLMLAEHHGSQMKCLAEVFAQKHDALYAAMTELVALKDMKDELSLMLLREEGGMGLDYDRRKPIAWQRARELVTPNAALTRRP
jgi:hypothetical protein